MKNLIGLLQGYPLELIYFGPVTAGKKCHDLLLAVAFKVTAPTEVLMIIEGEFRLCVLFAPWLILHGFLSSAFCFINISFVNKFGS